MTFDYVNEPGIHIAEKYKSLTLESRYDKPVTRQGLGKALDRQALNFGRESVTLDEKALFRSLGWEEKSNAGFLAKW